MGHKRGRRVAGEVLARSKRSGRAAKHQAKRRPGVAQRRGRQDPARGAGGTSGEERRGRAAGRTGTEDAHPGHQSQKRTPAAHTGPQRHATPAPPSARVTLTLPPPPGQRGPAPARKTRLGSARVGVEGLRGPVQPQPPEAKPNASPEACSGPLGDVDGALRAPPFVQACLRNDRRA